MKQRSNFVALYAPYTKNMLYTCMLKIVVFTIFIARSAKNLT